MYVAGKHRACHEVGMASFDIQLPESTTQEELHAKIDEVCADPAIHGMIVQLPLRRTSTRTPPSTASSRRWTPTA